MGIGEKDNGTPAHRIPESDPMGFLDVYPTETRGDGALRRNNVNTGAAQGKGGWKKKVRCKQCGFLVNLNQVDFSGGSLDGAGAGGVITQSADVGTLSNGGTTDDGMTDGVGDANTHKVGEQAYKKGAGCPMCFSKNSSRTQNITLSPSPKPYIGF